MLLGLNEQDASIGIDHVPGLEDLDHAPTIYMEYLVINQYHTGLRVTT